MLGTINPVREIAARAHDAGALMLVDGAQSVPHMPVNVQELGDRLFGLQRPQDVRPDRHRRAVGPARDPRSHAAVSRRRLDDPRGHAANDDLRRPAARFEAGTPAIGEAIALGEAVDFLSGLGMDKIFAHEQHLIGYALERLSEVEGLRVYGPRSLEQRGGALSFTLDGVHPHDIAAVLDGEGIAVRAGHHCCQPLHTLLDVPATARASFYLYNIPEEIDRLAAGLEKARKLFA